MAVKGDFLFSYKTGNSFLYKLNPSLKLLLLFVLSSVAFVLPIKVNVIIFALVIIFQFCIHIPLRDQLKSLKPVAFYFFILYGSEIITSIVETHTFVVKFPENTTVTLLLRLALAMQFSSIFFRCTTPIQTRESLENIERKIQSVIPFPNFSAVLSLLILFIPSVFDTYNQLNVAYQARNGKNNFIKILILLPPLFSLCMYKARLTSNSMENRLS